MGNKHYIIIGLAVGTALGYIFYSNINSWPVYSTVSVWGQTAPNQLV